MIGLDSNKKLTHKIEMWVTLNCLINRSSNTKSKILIWNPCLTQQYPTKKGVPNHV